MKKLIMLFLLMAVVGCHDIETVNLVDGASKVKIYRKSDPPATCVEISPFSVVSGSGCGALGSPGDFAAAYNEFRNKIVEMGGNAGLINDESPPHPAPGCYVNSYLMNGVAYKCPSEVMPALSTHP